MSSPRPIPHPEHEPPALLPRRKQRNALHKPINVLLVPGHVPPVHRDHLGRPDRVEVVHAHAAVALDAEDARLAVLALAGVAAVHVVVVEEAVQAGAVDQHVRAVDDAQAPAGIAGRKHRVAVRRVRRERQVRPRVRLVVRRLGLHLAHEHVARAGELVLVQLVVLGAGADQPHPARRALHQQPAPGVHADLLVVGAVLDVVVRHPHPRVLHVHARRRPRQVHAQERGHAPRRHVVRRGHRRVGRLGAVGQLQVGPGKAADAHVHVPQARRRRRRRREVVLEQDSPRLRAARGQDRVGPLDPARLAGRADLHDGLGARGGAEEGAGREDHGERLAEDARAGGDPHRLGDQVHAGVEEDDLVGGGGGGEERVERVRVVRRAVALGARRARADELGQWQVLVLRLRPLVEGSRAAAAAAEQRGRARVGRDGALERRRARRRRVAVPAAPGFDHGGTGRAGEDGARGPADGRRHVVEREVLQDQVVGHVRAGGIRVAEDDADRRVLDGAVDDSGGADREGRLARRLVRRRGREVEADLAVVDGHALISPAPGPQLLDGRLRVVDGDVAEGELLVADRQGLRAAEENQIADVAAGALLDEQALVLGAGSLRRVEDDVGQRRRLRAGPVDARDQRRRRHVRDVDDEVGHLAPEHVGGAPCEAARRLVRVAVEEPAAVEVGGSLEHRQAAGVADQLRVVVVDDGRRDHVRARREVHERRRLAAAGAARAAAVAVADGQVDGRRVVRNAIALGAVVLDVAVDLVARVCEGAHALMADLFEPEVGAGWGGDAGGGGSGGGGGQARGRRRCGARKRRRARRAAGPPRTTRARGAAGKTRALGVGRRSGQGSRQRPGLGHLGARRGRGANRDGRADHDGDQLGRLAQGQGAIAIPRMGGDARDQSRYGKERLERETMHLTTDAAVCSK
ncbi:8bdce749-e62e-4af3-8c1f-5a9c97833852 [Thermothielavioides terrestris]|uniref:8bdce749-e62e-4af3-8c1f-5a9c97833852 n=1 Tax=Thermothielavioides terrestris TaxID=2587410 RepID=A0A446BLR3_9PEZI|nr:8bdce749-e62e-4af3-8c1f-5a9c97833852 [Thermothielavioides terrestris]